MALKWSRVVRRTAGVQLKLLGRAWPARLADLLMPSAIALVPVILGRAVAGEQAGVNFARYAATANFAGFLLIGGGCFLLVTRALWGFGGWLRQSMAAGTLESLYLSPAPMPAILAGVALAFAVYSALIFAGAMVVGAILFRVALGGNQGWLAPIFLLVGLPPVYGLALLYGALVLRVKETDAFIQIAQWLAALLMGVYVPLAVFPPALKLAGLLFPPAWLAHDLRAALLGIPYLSPHWSIDAAVLALFAVAGPWLGYAAFARAETSLRQSAGLGSDW